MHIDIRVIPLAIIVFCQILLNFRKAKIPHLPHLRIAKEQTTLTHILVVGVNTCLQVRPVIRPLTRRHIDKVTRQPNLRVTFKNGCCSFLRRLIVAGVLCIVAENPKLKKIGSRLCSIDDLAFDSTGPQVHRMVGYACRRTKGR